MNNQLEKELRRQFILFSALNKTIAVPQLNKWFKQAGVFDEFITHAEIEKTFSHMRWHQIDYKTFLQLLQYLFETKNKIRPLHYYVEKLTSCGPPSSLKMTVPNVEALNNSAWSKLK
ncbi:uncharacterized protein LOC103312171 isoform X2 [Tribolium castaneum]|uniref:Uncharacterized protein n=1 Tax=Tribolium castaneum TaxID=7070 RepID=A0A139WMB7_TRICA|nr:PREDICTED: uncharacterized protein LOC103312171 isoform X2 [Tribolium castaneum]KYB29033.1 hypothetical protein TcasGA2_TC032252 [Tribolium castaneum]|eukprot:XP_008190365.1 PREDICTED: uncharacterized protein LOC103312171 isoform X2 [Tribolium castaneum]